MSKGAWRVGWVRALLFAGAAGFVLMLMPSVLAAYPLIILSHMLVFSIACLGLNLLYGTAGSFSLGHATYFGTAAYTGAFLIRFSPVDSFEGYFAAGVLTSTVFAAVIGFFSVRTSKIFFAILTLAFSIAAFIASILALWRISRSPFGQALRAIRENDTRAAFIGIPVWQYRWYAFILSGFFVGLAGGLYGQLARQITPEQLHWIFSMQLVLAVVLGGSRHFLGPVWGAFVFVSLEEIASQWTVGRYAMFGLLLILAVFFFPRGIAGGVAILRDAVKRYRS